MDFEKIDPSMGAFWVLSDDAPQLPLQGKMYLANQYAGFFKFLVLCKIFENPCNS